MTNGNQWRFKKQPAITVHSMIFFCFGALFDACWFKGQVCQLPQNEFHTVNVFAHVTAFPQSNMSQSLDVIFFPRHSFFRSIMFRDSLGWGVLGDRKIQLERIFRVPRPNPYHHYCYFVSICPLQISDPPSTTIALLNALAATD